MPEKSSEKEQHGEENERTALRRHASAQEKDEDPEARGWLLGQRITSRRYGAEADDVRASLAEMDSDLLTGHLVGGMSLRELPFRLKGLLGKKLHPDDFVLPPLPNHLFMRDSSFWIQEGVSISSMASQYSCPSSLSIPSHAKCFSCLGRPGCISIASLL